MSQDKHKSINSSDPSYLILSRPGRKPVAVPLDRGESVFLGSGSNCRIMLESESVQPIHCMVLLDEQKQLKVQDWNTGQTYLNGALVETEAEFCDGDQLQVGDYQIIAVLSQEYHAGMASEILEQRVQLDSPNSSAKVSMSQFSAKSFDLGTEAATELEAASETQSELLTSGHLDESEDSANLQEAAQKEAACQEAYQVAREKVETDFPDVATTDPASPMPEQRNAMLSAEALETYEQKSLVKNAEGGFEYDIDADLRDDFDEGFDAAWDSFDSKPQTDFVSLSDAAENENTADTDTELLQLEVEQLRYDLADRDNQIADLRQQLESGQSSPIDENETLKLVTRLEELLEELQASDERVRSLEELLRLSDQATQAEQEERRQLENWVGEIEERVQQHDAEQEAEANALRKKLAAANEQLKHADIQFKKLLADGQQATDSEDSRQQALLGQCKQQIEQLQRQVETLQRENDELNERPIGLPEDREAQQEVHALKQQLAQLQVETSRERAEMARRHAELERIRDELEDKVSSAREFSQGDSRIKAMREHLREIHEQEQQEKEDRRQQSLGGRIANLLTRLK